MNEQALTLLSKEDISALVKGQVEEILAKSKTETVEMEKEKAGVLSQLTGFEVFGIPVGSAAAGGLTAMVISGVVDLAMKPVRTKLGTRLGDTALKALCAYAVNRWGEKFLGEDGKRAATIILTWEAFESLVPELVTKVQNLLPAPSGVTTPPGRTESWKKVVSDTKDTATKEESIGSGAGGGLEYYQRMGLFN